MNETRFRTNPSRVALVTGASSGIGRASAFALQHAGFVVVASARSPQDVAALERDGLLAVAIDVTDERSMVAGVAAAEAKGGRIGVLVNNAGYALAGAIEELAMDDLRRQFETNLFGLIRMTQLVLPGMRERGAGRIVNIGSLGGEVTFPGEGAYHATKYAIEAISDALRVEVGQFGIEAVLIQPTVVRTPFLDKLDAQFPAATDAGASPYAPLLRAFQETMRLVQAKGGPALATTDAVARAVVKAATVDRPRARYKVGWSATATSATRRALPDGVWDTALRKALRVRGPADAGVEQAPAP